MPPLQDRALLEYLDALLPPRDDLLVTLEEQARRERIPIGGPHVGTLLGLLITAAKPTLALEVGTAIGYSAIWMGRALRPYGGTLATIEPRQDRIEQARANLARAGLSDVVEVIPGAALDVLPALRERFGDESFGLIFIDALKPEYPAYFEGAFPLLADGGLLVADNALLGGEVRPDAPRGYWPPQDREGIRRYNALAFGHADLQTVLLPLRDGLTVSVRRESAAS